MPLPPPLRLGALELASPFVLAPLESVSDAAFRALCFEQGAALTFTEMVRARGVAGNNASTLQLVDTHEPHVPTGVQLLAINETELLSALERLEALAQTTHPHLAHLRAVDLNLGCPSPDVIRLGAGPAMLKRRAKLRVLFETLAAWRRRTTLPVAAVGAKIRLGLNANEQEHKVYLPVVEAANDTLDYLTVHARHARQKSTDRPSWKAIAEAKQAARIPIIANGDVFCRADAELLHARTRCDGFMIARGAIRSPWVFRELSGRGPLLPTPDELARAEAAYFERAAAWQTKKKYLDWHREGFARLRERLAHPEQALHVPASANLP